jgi:hypothetical protein
VLFFYLIFCKNLGFSLSEHCEWGTSSGRPYGKCVSSLFYFLNITHFFRMVFLVTWLDKQVLQEITESFLRGGGGGGRVWTWIVWLPLLNKEMNRYIFKTHLRWSLSIYTLWLWRYHPLFDFFMTDLKPFQNWSR